MRNANMAPPEIERSSEFSRDTIQLKKMARLAGAVAQRARAEGLDISTDIQGKGFVTSGDKAVDRHILADAKYRFRNADVLSEESPTDFNPRNSEVVLIVDPIDGTRIYKEGGKNWSINLAIVKNGEVVSSVIYQPDLGVLTFAEKGKGAFSETDGTREQIFASSNISLAESTVHVGANFSDTKQQAEINEILVNVNEKSRGPRILESTGYELALLAKSKGPMINIHPHAQPWDKAAGMLIINEAGGLATGWPGRDAIFGKGVLAASNSVLYRKARRLVNTTMAETIYEDPEFERKKTKYFQAFMWGHYPQARMYKEYGLLGKEEGARGWRNVAKHQLLSGVVTETIAELIGMTDEESERLTNISLTHDVDKRRQHESKSKQEVIEEELLDKTERPLVATTSNFTDFPNWDIEEYIIRYVDSSVGEDDGSHWYGAREPNNLPDVVTLPWRKRVQMFKDAKVEEGEKGREFYGMTTWEKLEEVMEKIEADLFKKIIEKNPELAKKYTKEFTKKYPDPSSLTQLIEDRIREKIRNS